VAFKQWKLEIAGRDLVVEHGKMARQSAGSVVVRLGDTVVLITANCKKSGKILLIWKDTWWVFKTGRKTRRHINFGRKTD